MRKFLQRINLKRGIWDYAYYIGYCAGQYDKEKGEHWFSKNGGMTIERYEREYQIYKPKLKDLLTR